MITFKDANDFYGFLAFFDSGEEALEFISIRHDGEINFTEPPTSLIINAAHIPENFDIINLGKSLMLNVKTLPTSPFEVRVPGNLHLYDINEIPEDYEFPNVGGYIYYGWGGELGQAAHIFRPKRK